MLPHFHIYAVDTIGHPGKSAETSLSPFSKDYGKWVKEMIEKLGYDQIVCFGGSFGAGKANDHPGAQIETYIG